MKKSFFLLALSLSVQAQTPLPRDSGAREILLEATRKEKEGDLLGASALLERALSQWPRDKVLTERLYRINKKFHLTSVAPPGTMFYRVRPGDSLTRIARRFTITVGLLRRLNDLATDNLKVGQKLKVVKGPFDVRVVKDRFILQVLRKGKILFTYPVGLGKGNSTPVGTFVVGPRLVRPVQYDRERGRKYPYGHPEHTIGTRWITFSKSYGIHGTVFPESIGKQESHGCVRMLNRNVEELFDLLVTGKSKVTIVENDGRASGTPSPSKRSGGPGRSARPNARS